MSVQSVNSSHFVVAGNKKKTLNLKVRGNVLMFFKMDNCPGCAQFEPVFYQLASQMQNVTFLVANISHDRNIIGMSRQTNTPIEKVPYIMLYVNGLPKAKFNGKKNIPSLQNFVSKVLNVVSQQQQSSFVQPQPQGYHPGASQGYNPGGYAQQPQQPKVYQPDLQMKLRRMMKLNLKFPDK